jgi:hypothetical protein
LGAKGGKVQALHPAVFVNDDRCLDMSIVRLDMSIVRLDISIVRLDISIVRLDISIVRLDE